MNKELILASASPRRSELLKLMGYDFKVIPSFVDEHIFPSPKTPAKLTESIAFKKARDVFDSHSDACVIAADTLVVLNDQILGKPRDDAEAFTMLKQLSGNTHHVFTGLCVLTDTFIEITHEVTSVTFELMSDAEISAYISTGEPADKAGAYGIQGYGAVFISRINGCYFNVMGLPVSKLYKILKRI